MGQNQWYRFGVGAPPILEPILVGIESDVHWGCDSAFDPWPCGLSDRLHLGPWLGSRPRLRPALCGARKWGTTWWRAPLASEFEDQMAGAVELEFRRELFGVRSSERMGNPGRAPNRVLSFAPKHGPPLGWIAPCRQTQFVPSRSIHTIPYHTIPHHTTPHHTTPHHTTPHHTTPHHTTPHHTTPHHTTPHHTTPHHTTPHHTTPHHTTPYHTIPYHTIPYHTIPYHTIPHMLRAAAGGRAEEIQQQIDIHICIISRVLICILTY